MFGNPKMSLLKRLCLIWSGCIIYRHSTAGQKHYVPVMGPHVQATKLIQTLLNKPALACFKPSQLRKISLFMVRKILNAFAESPPLEQGFFIQPDCAFHKWWRLHLIHLLLMATWYWCYLPVKAIQSVPVSGKSTQMPSSAKLDSSLQFMPLKTKYKYWWNTLFL